MTDVSRSPCVWCNFTTEDYDYLQSGHVFTDEQAIQYIPQDASSQGIFHCSRHLGLSIWDSIVYVLESVLDMPHSVELPSDTDV